MAYVGRQTIVGLMGPLTRVGTIVLPTCLCSGVQCLCLTCSVVWCGVMGSQGGMPPTFLAGSVPVHVRLSHANY